MPLQLTHRPTDFESFLGNKETVSDLKSVFSREDKPHAILFCGPTGCGKTTLGRLVAFKLLNCSEFDFYELDSSNTRGIDTIREIRQTATYHPTKGNVKVFLLDECHSVTGTAAEALLKFLEDTPKHVYNILCTNLPEKLTATIKNRCHVFRVAKLTQDEMCLLVDTVVEKECIKSISVDVLVQVINSADGCPRRALILIDQIMGLTSDEEQLKIIKSSEFDEFYAMDICRKLASSGTPKNKWESLVEMLNNLNDDPELVRRSILGYCSSAILKNKEFSECKKFLSIAENFKEPYYNTGKPGLILSCYRAVWRIDGI